MKGNVLIYGLMAFFATSCVTARKYDEMKAARVKAEQENESCRKANEGLTAQVNELTSKNGVLKNQVGELESDSVKIGRSYRTLQEKYDKINELNDILTSKSNALLGQASDENRKLTGELDVARTELQKREDAVKFLEKSLQEKEATLDKANADLQEREKRLGEMDKLLAAQEAASNALKQKISAALLSFKDKGISVHQMNGKVYVNMEAKLLFASGSTEVKGEGKAALIDLAKAIENETDMEIVVEGHTDTDKLASATYPRDNWDLSVLRATEVIKIMTASSKLSPKVLSAAGRSEYQPVDATDKAKNRRIEIILSPRLDELYQIIDNN